MDKFNFPTSKDIYIEVNDVRLATVENYTLKTICDSNYIESFGESEPVATVKGRVRYEINVSKMYVCEDNIDFYNLSDFNFVVIRGNKKVVYKGCQLNNIKEFNKNSFIEDVTIIAARRLEIN